MNPTRALAVLLLIALPSCNIIQQFLPKPAKIGISIKAPSGNTTSVRVKAGSFDTTYSDDSRGFATKIEVDAGTLSISPDVLAGFKARINTTGKLGNKNYGDFADIPVSSDESLAVTVQYDSLTPQP
jgi:hypothetical protein